MWLVSYNFFIFFSPKTLLPLVINFLQMRLLYTNPCGDAIGPSYMDAHRLNKGGRRPLLDEG